MAMTTRTARRRTNRCNHGSAVPLGGGRLGSGRQSVRPPVARAVMPGDEDDAEGQVASARPSPIQAPAQHSRDLSRAQEPTLVVKAGGQRVAALQRAGSTTVATWRSASAAGSACAELGVPLSVTRPEEAALAAPPLQQPARRGWSKQLQHAPADPSSRQARSERGSRSW